MNAAHYLDTHVNTPSNNKSQCLDLNLVDMRNWAGLGCTENPPKSVFFFTLGKEAFSLLRRRGLNRPIIRAFRNR